MRQNAADVYQLEGLRNSNVYARAIPGGIVLIDSGLSGSVDQIAAQLEQVGYGLSDLQAVVLTHAHADHIGSAAELARRSGARVLAHHAEALLIEGTRYLPATPLLLRALMWVGKIQRRLFSGPAFPQVDQALDDGEVLEALGGLQVIHTPGHTPGSICLYQPEIGVLFCGDLLFNGNPLTGRGGLRFTISLVSVDAAQARESVQRLQSLPVEVLCCGHGAPILQGAGEGIRELLATSA